MASTYDGAMDIRGLFVGSDREEETDWITYWCTVCGMTFERSSPRIDYFWCTRCGAEGVRKLPWPTPP